MFTPLVRSARIYPAPRSLRPDLAVSRFRRHSWLLGLLKADPDTEIVAAGGSLFEGGAALCADRPDKAWSLPDCISFSVTANRGLTEALTCDHHFEQTSFRAPHRE